MEEGTMAKLTDVVLKFKAAVEDKDLDTLRELVGPDVRINVMGRFYTAEALLANLKIIFERLEQPTLDVVSIEESEVTEDMAFVSYAAEVSWIDQQTWEEQSQNVSISLQHRRAKQEWTLEGLTISHRHVPEPPDIDVPPRPPTKRPDRRLTGGVDDLFSFWY